MKRAKIFVLLLSFGLASNSQNLVLNPGFESWSKINKPSGWTHAENCLKDSVITLSGQYSCQHTGGASTSSDLGQAINVVSGKEYALSFSFRTAPSTSGNGARIWCYWRDISGNSLTDPISDDILRPSKYMKSETWQNVVISVTAPAGAVSFYLEVRTYPNSVSYWDDFVFEEKTLTGYDDSYYSLLTIYPNPAKDFIFIKNAETLRQFDVVNSAGVVILSSKLANENLVRIGVAELPAGIYILRLYLSGSILNRRFIKKDD